MKNLYNKFWNWYQRHETFNLGLAVFLFGLQIVHLIWLTGDVVYFRLAGNQFFSLDIHHGETNMAGVLILIVDYLEIPAIFTTSLVYINELKKEFNQRSLWFLFFINSQWLHILWITDEYVLETFTAATGGTLIPFWLAWVAILIDYLELPVIFDTLNKFYRSYKKEGLKEAVRELKEE